MLTWIRSCHSPTSLHRQLPPKVSQLLRHCHVLADQQTQASTDFCSAKKVWIPILKLADQQTQASTDNRSPWKNKSLNSDLKLTDQQTQASTDFCSVKKQNKKLEFRSGKSFARSAVRRPFCRRDSTKLLPPGRKAWTTFTFSIIRRVIIRYKLFCTGVNTAIYTSSCPNPNVLSPLARGPISLPT